MEHTFIKDRDIVLFGFQRWDAGLGNNFREMAIELSKHNRVLYVNRAPDRISALKQAFTSPVKLPATSDKHLKYNILQIHSRLWVQDTGIIIESINWLPAGWLYNQVALLNGRRLSKQIGRAIRQLQFENIIFINDNDFLRGYFLQRYLSYACSIFYLRDFLTGVGYFMRHGPRLERACIQSADLVIANSIHLAKYAGTMNPDSFDIGQGFDCAMYLEPVTHIPDDMQHIKKPVIGYAGYVSVWRIDMEIIQYIARQFPQCSIVLVGPVDKRFSTASMHHLKNVYFLGSKPPAEIPAYINCFDVCLNPQQLNAVTAGNYPRKADEYLALGKLVVATRTEAMEMFAQYTYLCSAKTAFADTIRRMLDNPAAYMSQAEAERRKTFALTHTWTASIGRLGDACFLVNNKAKAINA